MVTERRGSISGRSQKRPSRYPSLSMATWLASTSGGRASPKLPTERRRCRSEACVVDESLCEAGMAGHAKRVGKRGSMDLSELRHLGGRPSFVPQRCAVPASHRLDSSMARPWASLAVCHGHQSEAAPPLQLYTVYRRWLSITAFWSLSRLSLSIVSIASISRGAVELQS